MKTDGVLLDLDGTLWDSVDEVVLTWNRVIARHPGLRPPLNRREQQTLMGLQMDEIARRVFPDQPRERQLSLMRACEQEENDYLRLHGAKLYPGVPETLKALHGTYPLLIVSNCQSGYIEAFLESHHLEDRIDGFLCFGDTGHGKADNMRALADRYGLRYPVYVGDTQGDRDAAREAGIPFIHAAYGFGTADSFVSRIESFPDLIPLLSKPE